METEPSILRSGILRSGIWSTGKPTLPLSPFSPTRSWQGSQFWRPFPNSLGRAPQPTSSCLPWRIDRSCPGLGEPLSSNLRISRLRGMGQFKNIATFRALTHRVNSIKFRVFFPEHEWVCMTIRAPLEITITSMRNCLGTKDGAQFRNPKLHTVPLHRTRCGGAAPLPEGSLQTRRGSQIVGWRQCLGTWQYCWKQNTQHSRRKTP